MNAVQEQESMEAMLPSERRRRSAKYLDHKVEGQPASPADTADSQPSRAGTNQDFARREAYRSREAKAETASQNPKNESSETKERKTTGTRGYKPQAAPKSQEKGKSTKKAAGRKSADKAVAPAQSTGSMPQVPGNQETGGMRTEAVMPRNMQGTAGFQTTGSMTGSFMQTGGYQNVGMTGAMPQTGGYQTPMYYPVQGQTAGNAAVLFTEGASSAGYPVGNMPSQGVPHNGSGIYPAAYVQNMNRGFTPPPQPPKPAASRSGGKNPGGKKPKSGLQKGLIIALSIAAAAALILIGVQTVRSARAERELRAAVEPYNDRYVEGVYVDGISLGGLTQEQARDVVTSNAQQRSSAWSVRLTYQGQLVREISASELSMQVKVEDALQEAWQQGHVGDLAERRSEMERLRAEPYEGYTATPSGDTSVIDSILADIAQAVYRAPVDATLATFNPDMTYPFTFNEEVVGRSLNVEPVKEEIYHRLSSMQSGDIELDFTMTEPKVTVQDLKDHVVALRGTATTPISSHSTEERNNNIRVAFSRVSGTILQPGQQFSFNNIVGERTTKNGFYPAIEYAYGELAEGIGGGVCQASTTVYLAAVRAGMNIVKREPHSREVSYIDFGKDATVYWYSNHKIDMVFKNTSSSPVYITAAVQSSNTKKVNLMCVVNIYGADLGNQTYDIETVLTPIEAPTEPKYVKDRNAEYVTYTDQEYVYSKAQPGTIVDAYLVTYEGSTVVDRRYMYTDTYDAQPQVIYVGVTPREK